MCFGFILWGLEIFGAKYRTQNNPPAAGSRSRQTSAMHFLAKEKNIFGTLVSELTSAHSVLESQFSSEASFKRLRIL